MKKIILLASILLLAAGCVKEQPVQVINYPTPTPVVTPKPENNDWQTYTNSTSGFSIKYSADFTVVDPTKIQAQQISYIPVCNPDVAVCLLMGKDKYGNTNFEGAGVSVNILSDLNTEAKCYNFKVSTNESQIPVADVVINGVTFKTAAAGGAAVGHSDKQQIYRNFYNRKCYELIQDVTQTNIQNYEPGTVKEFNQDDVWQKLQGIVNTFIFEALTTTDNNIDPKEILVSNVQGTAELKEYKGNFESNFEGYITNFDASLFYPANIFKVYKSDLKNYVALRDSKVDRFLKIGFYSNDAIGASAAKEYWDIIKPCPECKQIPNKVEIDSKEVLTFSKEKEEWVIYSSAGGNYVIIEMYNPDAALRAVVKTLKVASFVKRPN